MYTKLVLTPMRIHFRTIR